MGGWGSDGSAAGRRPLPLLLHLHPQAHLPHLLRVLVQLSAYGGQNLQGVGILPLLDGEVDVAEPGCKQSLLPVPHGHVAVGTQVQAGSPGGSASPAQAPHRSSQSSRQPSLLLLPLPLPPLLLLLLLAASSCCSSSSTSARYAAANCAALRAASSAGRDGSASAVRRKLPIEWRKISNQSSSAGKVGLPLRAGRRRVVS